VIGSVPGKAVLNKPGLATKKNAELASILTAPNNDPCTLTPDHRKVDSRPEPSALDRKPQTLYPGPHTLNPKPLPTRPDSDESEIMAVVGEP